MCVCMYSWYSLNQIEVDSLLLCWTDRVKQKDDFDCMLGYRLAQSQNPLFVQLCLSSI